MMPSHLPQETLVLNSVSTHCADSAVWSGQRGEAGRATAGMGQEQTPCKSEIFGHGAESVGDIFTCTSSATPEASKVNVEQLLHMKHGYPMAL